MKSKPRCIEYAFPCAFGKICLDFVAEKRAMGRIFNSQAKKLREFCNFCSKNFPNETILTEGMVREWILGDENTADRSIYHRYEVIKGLAQYMLRMQIQAYCPTASDIPKIHWHTYSPHIFTRSEVTRFFRALDSYPKAHFSNSHRRHIVMPIIFRLLYGCGMRVSEVLNLKPDDINLDNGIITIRQAKFEQVRYVPMLPEIAERLRAYMVKLPNSEFLFPSRDGGKYHDKTVYEQFRQVLKKTGIPHKGRGKGPRVHDFRHTFAVHSFQQAERQGIPISSYLPRISACLGHNSLNATEHYLHWTEEFYPEISDKLHKTFENLIPDGGATDENN